MKVFLTVLVFVLVVGKQQVDAIVGGECIVSSVLRTQSDLDSIKADCTRIVGSLNLECEENSEDPITSLEVFRLVEEITGFLRVERCSQLVNLEPGFGNLKAIHGETLYTAPGVGDGFGLYVVQNSALTSLGGLQNLTAVAGNRTRGYGRVYIVQNELLCGTDKIDWLVVAGENWQRAVYELEGEEANCQSYSCSTACSCDLCVGPGDTHCQGICASTGSERDVLIITTLTLVMIVSIILFIFAGLYVTDRCGCKMKCYGRRLHFGIAETERHRRESQQKEFPHTVPTARMS